MTSPILGPPSIGLVPDARVVAIHNPTWTGSAVSCNAAGEWWVYWRTGDCSDMGMRHSAADLALDLSGKLDFGSRALLRLVAPEEPEPLTAPGWHYGGWDWYLGGYPTAVHFRTRPVSRPGRVFCVPGISEERDPRKALSLALAALAGGKR